MRTRRPSARFDRQDGIRRVAAGSGHHILSRLDRDGEGVDGSYMGDAQEFDIDALLSGSIPPPPPSFSNGPTAQTDREIAVEFAKLTKVTTLLLMGNLGPTCLPASCEGMCPSFKLISMRSSGSHKVAMFSVPVEREMAELFEEIDGRPGLRAIAYDAHGRTKDAYVL